MTRDGHRADAGGGGNEAAKQSSKRARTTANQSESSCTASFAIWRIGTCIRCIMPCRAVSFASSCRVRISGQSSRVRARKIETADSSKNHSANRRRCKTQQEQRCGSGSSATTVQPAERERERELDRSTVPAQHTKNCRSAEVRVE